MAGEARNESCIQDAEIIFPAPSYAGQRVRQVMTRSKKNVPRLKKSGPKMKKGAMPAPFFLLRDVI